MERLTPQEINNKLSELENLIVDLCECNDSVDDENFTFSRLLHHCNGMLDMIYVVKHMLNGDFESLQCTINSYELMIKMKKMSDKVNR